MLFGILFLVVTAVNVAQAVIPGISKFLNHINCHSPQQIQILSISRSG